jgi:hypothetical protein
LIGLDRALIRLYPALIGFDASLTRLRAILQPFILF